MGETRRGAVAVTEREREREREIRIGVIVAEIKERKIVAEVVARIRRTGAVAVIRKRKMMIRRKIRMMLRRKIRVKIRQNHLRIVSLTKRKRQRKAIPLTIAAMMAMQRRKAIRLMQRKARKKMAATIAAARKQ